MAAEEDYPQEPSHPMPEDDDTESDENKCIVEEPGNGIVDKDSISKQTAAHKALGYRTCTVLAHNKMVLHSLKHLSRPVFGLLIGITYKDSNHTCIHVMDTIPLQHNFFSSMVIEVGFLQIQEYLNKICKSRDVSGKNLRILGVYFANGHLDDASKNTSAIIIASQLIKEYSRQSSLMCQIQSDRIESAYKGSDTSLDWYMLRNNGDSENKRDWKGVDDIYIVKGNRDRINVKDDPNSYGNWLINLKPLQSLD
eukprot:UN01945